VKGYFAGPEWLGLTWDAAPMSVEQENYRFDVYVLGRLYRRVLVDRRTLSVSAIRRYDVAGRLLTAISMDDFRREGDSPFFPRRLTVDRPQQGVRVELRLDEPVLNQPLPLAVFQTGKHRGWTLIDLDWQDISEVKGFSAE
jgi:hypothetical protein